ncbi:MAG TPA: glycerophosphodiester phosphodiesterase [Anaerolineales bacterium]
MGLELLKSQTGRTLIESRRGIEGDVPENSWPAIQLGHQLGADLIEVDVQLSRDGVAFLRHNYQLPDRRWCHNLCWDELMELKVDGELMPKLEDVLVWARERNAFLSLDLKTSFSSDGNLTKEVIRLLGRTKTNENVLLLFFDHEELAQTKLAYPDLKVRALLRGRLVNYADYIQKIGADCAVLSYDLFHPVDIDRFHTAEIAVALCEMWNPDTDLFRSVDVDIFSYGNPVQARQILQSAA